MKSNKLVVTIDPTNQLVKFKIQQYANISFYDPKLIDDFLFIETTKSMDFIKSIDGVIDVREQYMYKVSI